MKKILVLLLWVGFSIFDNAFASQLTIVYTGQTHATLFPCHCPGEPAGGVSRRATKISQLRKENPNLLLLEAGNSFAGADKDYNKQTEELDRQRTDVYLSSLKMMGYAAIGADGGSFKYGKDFLKNLIKQTGLEFISLNNSTLKSHIVKDINDLKIAIIGFAGHKLGESGKSDSDKLKNLINKLRKGNVNLIIVLTDQNPEDDYRLAKEIEGIDCIISTATYGANQKQVIEIGDTLFAFSYWQARRLSRLNLDVEDGKIKSYSYDEIKLTPDVPDDPEVAALLAKYPAFKR